MCFVTSRYLEIASVQFYGRPPIRRCVRNAYSNKPIVRVGSGRADGRRRDGGTTGARTTGRQAGRAEGGRASERASERAMSRWITDLKNEVPQFVMWLTHSSISVMRRYVTEKDNANCRGEERNPTLEYGGREGGPCQGFGNSNHLTAQRSAKWRLDKHTSVRGRVTRVVSLSQDAIAVDAKA